MPHNQIPEIDSEDLRSLELELRTEPKFDWLSVFIRDTTNHDLYWYRKLGVSRGVQQITPGVKLPYIDVKVLDMGDIYRVPCPSSMLEGALEMTSAGEAELQNHPETRDIQATVGIARYNGSKRIPIEQLETLVGIKYFYIRQGYIASLG